MFRSAAAAFAALLVAGLPAAAHASPYSDNLSRCLVQHATRADREALMVWTFAAISRHPQAQRYVTMTEADRNAISRSAAAVFMRLLTADCRAETIELLRYDPRGVEVAFEALGEVASAEMMGGPDVSDELNRLMEYFDMEALGRLGRDAGLAPMPATPGKSRT